MSFNELPDNVVIQILTQLDDLSKLGVMSVFERWAEIFGSSSQLIDKFKLEINYNIVGKWKLEDLPNIAIKNVSFYGPYREDPSDCLIPILKKYEQSIKSITISGGKFSSASFSEILKLKNLEHLKLDDAVIRPLGFFNECQPTTPTIKSLDIAVYSRKINRVLDLFNNCVSIEKLSIRYLHNGEFQYDEKPDLDCDVLYDLIKSLPNLKHFNFWNFDTERYDCVISDRFPITLEKLEISCLTFNGRNEQFEFLWSQKDTMKELIIHEDPKRMEYYSSDILEFILTEMNLKYF